MYLCPKYLYYFVLPLIVDSLDVTCAFVQNLFCNNHYVFSKSSSNLAWMCAQTIWPRQSLTLAQCPLFSIQQSHLFCMFLQRGIFNNVSVGLYSLWRLMTICKDAPRFPHCRCKKFGQGAIFFPLMAYFCKKYFFPTSHYIFVYNCSNLTRMCALVVFSCVQHFVSKCRILSSWEAFALPCRPVNVISCIYIS